MINRHLFSIKKIYIKSYFRFFLVILYMIIFQVSAEDKAARELAAFQDLTRDLPETIALGLLVPFRSVKDCAYSSLQC